jgi:hypothetical protein
MNPIEDGSNNTKGEDSFNSDPPTPGFMPDTWDIMNKFPHPDAAVLTKIHAFRKTFGTRLPVVSNLWLMLWEENLLPGDSIPKHLLWALHFIKVYPLQALGCMAVGAFHSGIDPKNYQKWVWAYTEASPSSCM